MPHRVHGHQELIANQPFILHTLDKWRDAQGSGAKDVDPEVQSFDVEAYEQKLAQPGNILPRGYFAILKQVQQYLDGDYAGSVRTSLAFMAKAPDLLGIVAEHMHRFFA